MIAEKVLQLRGQPSPHEFVRTMTELWGEAVKKLFTIAEKHPTPFVIVPAKPLLPFVSLQQQFFIVIKDNQLAQHIISSDNPAIYDLLVEFRRRLLTAPHVELPHENLHQFLVHHPEYAHVLHYVVYLSFPVYILSPLMLTPCPASLVHLLDNRYVALAPHRIDAVSFPNILCNVGIYRTEWLAPDARRVIEIVLRHQQKSADDGDWLLPATELDLSRQTYYPIVNNVVPLSEFFSLVAAAGGVGK